MKGNVTMSIEEYDEMKDRIKTLEEATKKGKKLYLMYGFGISESYYSDSEVLELFSDKCSALRNSLNSAIEKNKKLQAIIDKKTPIQRLFKFILNK
jgi:hypothetical protein